MGTGKTVTLNSATIIGAQSGNYTLSSVGTTTANITAKTLTPNIVATNKVYDGNTTATLSSQTLTGVVSPDVVTLIVGAANLDN